MVEVKEGVTRLESYAADAADTMRRMLRIVSTEIADCPRLFSLAPTGGNRLGRARFWQRHYQLVLWCEHPGSWHSWSDATYDIDQPKSWLVKVGPYALLVVKTLQAVVPIAASVAGEVLTAAQLKNAQNEIQLMTTVVAAIPGIDEDWRSDSVFDQTPEPGVNQLTPPQGAAAARAVRLLLFEQDATHRFGDLRRVIAPSGEFLWVCPKHYADYDPGLPAIRRGA